MTCNSVTFLSRSWSGSTCTCNCRWRSPQMDTFATPGTPIRRGRIVQRASTDMSISDSLSEVSPIAMQRLAEETGLIMTGGFDTCGSMNTCVMRSCATWRARMTSVPFSKTSTIDERPGIDTERISSTQGVPLSMSASMGVVIMASTSWAERPRASVWISTYGRENSGNTSTGVSRVV